MQAQTHSWLQVWSALPPTPCLATRASMLLEVSLPPSLSHPESFLSVQQWAEVSANGTGSEVPTSCLGVW